MTNPSVLPRSRIPALSGIRIFLIHGPVLFIGGRKLYAMLTCAHKGLVTGAICLAATTLLSLIWLLAEALVKRGYSYVFKKA